MHTYTLAANSLQISYSTQFLTSFLRIYINNSLYRKQLYSYVVRDVIFPRKALLMSRALLQRNKGVAFDYFVINSNQPKKWNSYT